MTRTLDAAARLRAAFFVAVFLAFPAAAQNRAAGLPDFTELYEKQGATVVSIDVTQKIKRRQFPDLSEDDPFYEFFHRFAPQVPRRGTPRDLEQLSQGSGFIIGSDGYIVTNAHVVEGADELNVKLADHREFKAKVIGADKRTDVALLKIDAKGLPTVTIGDPDKLKVGEWVVAIGKPFGFENTMTAGIVSAKGRDLPQENLVPYIQTDAAVNPGNSGGPLFNLKGEVIGINAMIFTGTGAFMGVSFAVPIDVAMNAVTQLKEKGKVTRGQIRVTIQEVTKDTADAFGLPKVTGALVNSVEKGGPADKGGVEAGDIILKVDGKDVHTSTELPRIITTIRPGTKITLTVWRKGAQKDLAVTVAEAKEDQGEAAQRRGAPAPKEKAKPNRMGLSLVDLTDEQKKELEIKNGVGIEDITGPVRGNVRPGDVILAIVSHGQTTEARSAEQVNQVLSKVEKGGSVTLRLKRPSVDQEFYASLKLNGD
jgi:serine protease Do